MEELLLLLFFFLNFSMDELCAKDSFNLFVAVWASWVGEGKGLSYRGSIFSMQVFLTLSKRKKEKKILDWITI